VIGAGTPSRVRRFLLVIALGFGLPSLLWAQAGRLGEIRARGTLRVGTTGDYKPFTYRANEASPFVGLDIELARMLAETLEVRVEWVSTSWPTLMDDFNAGRFDVAMGGVSITAERARVADFSASYLRDGKTPIVRCADRERFQTIEQIDRPGVRVVVNPGGTNERFVRARLTRATLSVWPNNVTIFDRIVAGEADVMITDAIETRLQQRLRPALCAVHPEAPFDAAEKAYLLPRDAAFKSAVDAWLRPLVERGEIARRLERWLDHPWPRAEPAAINLAPLCELMAGRLALMPDVARYKWNLRQPIEDVARERQIIAGLRQEAVALGVPAAWAEEFFQAQIEAAKIVQRELFRQWETEKRGRFESAPDLTGETRPKLDAITPKLLRELAMTWPALSDPQQKERIRETARRVMSGRALSEAAVAWAVKPLL
jgi:chorismate mutase-like protein